MAKALPGVTRVILGLALALGATLVVAGAVVAAIGAIGVLVPAVSAGIAAIGPVLTGAGAAIAAYFWPVTLAIGAFITAVYLLRRAWTADFAGIRTTVMGAWSRVSLVFQGIRALMRSLKDGTGEISEELARQLHDAGLMSFVSGLFRVYYRLRECYAGLSQTLAHGFARARAILEPTARALLDAYAKLARSVFSLLEAFGLVSAAADASSFRTLGRALGTLLGIIVQVDAFILRGLIAPFVGVIRLIALVVRAVVWLAKVTVSAFTESARFAQRYLLPIRLIIEELRLAARVAYSFWQMLSGDVSFTEGLKAIGHAVFRFLTTPFRWVRDVAQGIWGTITELFSSMARLVMNFASAMESAILSLPLVSALANVFGNVRLFLAGDLGFFNAGKAMLTALAEGIWSAATLPYRMLKKVLRLLRRLLPFSDAQEGPLSDLTLSGAAFLRTFAQGMLSAAALPGRVLRRSLDAAAQETATPFRWAAGLAHRAWDGLRAAVAMAFDRSALPMLPVPATQPMDSRAAHQPAVQESIFRFLGSTARAVALAGLAAIQPTTELPTLRTETPAVARPMRPVPPQQNVAVLPARTVLPQPTLTARVISSVSPVIPRITVSREPVPAREPVYTALASQPSTASVPTPTQRQQQLLGETRGVVSARQPTADSLELLAIRLLLERLLAKQDELGQRPVDLSVVLRLDGRQIAQAVYKDLREQKVKNYETL